MNSDRVERPRCSRRRSAQVVIDKDKKDAAVVKEKVLVQEASATEISERAGAIAADAQADLDKALPALAAAVQCLKELKKAHIDEVKALKKPPGGVRLTLEVACVFFEVAPVKKPDPDDPSKKILDYVEPAGKSLLSNAGKFLEMLQEFDKDNIPDKVRDRGVPAVPSRHRRASSSREEVLGAFFVDFGPIRTASGPSRRVGERAVAAMA